MLFRYFQISDEWDRDNSRFIQSERVEDYSDRVKAIKVAGKVMCSDGFVRDVMSAEYSPEGVNCVSIDIYLGEV